MNHYLSTNISDKHPYISVLCDKDVKIIVIIPCYNETDLIRSLSSLNNCDQPKSKVEVITVINSSVSDSNDVLETNLKTLYEAQIWAKNNALDWIKFYFIDASNLPEKVAGVGLARKIGMDEAALRFEKINVDGIIACFDADSTCHSSYLVELENHFIQHPKSPACSIYFEHPLEGKEFTEENYIGIEGYELHLRYYKNALKYCGFPYAYHTIGSSMAVKNQAYQKQGGMNKRKAGEDFYFLQKMMVLGNFSELNTTTVYPSPRVSDRVPFGTGRAMQTFLNKYSRMYFTYNFNSFLDLKLVVHQLDILYYGDVEFPKPLTDFFRDIYFNDNIKKIRQNSTNEEHFKKLFFNWFNAFKVLKFMHFSRDNYYPNIPVTEASRILLKQIYGSYIAESHLLKTYRKLDLS